MSPHKYEARLRSLVYTKIYKFGENAKLYLSTITDNNINSDHNNQMITLTVITINEFHCVV